MKKLILSVVLVTLITNLLALTDENFDEKYAEELKIARVTLNKKINDKRILGYVYFEGFNFEGYEAESDGIEKMLEVTLKLLQAKYKENNQPFVFVGHSQGGLRVLAMSTYLKEV